MAFFSQCIQSAVLIKFDQHVILASIIRVIPVAIG